VNNAFATSTKSRFCNLGRMMTGATALVIGVTIFAPVASAQSCQDLWVERNQYYKDAGYCFKTQRAISYFGNAGCIYNNESSVPLSAAIRARNAHITRPQRALGC
jgi:hypothetical protein